MDLSKSVAFWIFILMQHYFTLCVEKWYVQMHISMDFEVVNTEQLMFRWWESGTRDNNVTGYSVPVSYTHLDVYKRQV